MQGNEETYLPRNRPLSGTIWSFFSWLRRSEQFSSESISSIGSDHSVVSFDFLGPNEYVTSKPTLTLSTNHTTDTCTKRLNDREIRRQWDHDMTIHRKYGLLRFEGSDSLPVKRNTAIYPRQQRATSEFHQKRTAHVPGKRRAPLPPMVAAVTLPRYKRKRPAPKPPSVFSHSDKENYEKIMQTSNNKKGNSDLHTQAANRALKDKVKVVRDKSFLKQIFDNRKSLNSDTSHVKFLPSISELDNEALQIIESKKIFKFTTGDAFHSETHSVNPWICTKCLRKYQSSVVECIYCQSNINKDNLGITDRDIEKKNDDKEKLKIMLKEMKHSLPKRIVQKEAKEAVVTETSTLKIGYTNDDNQRATTSKMLSDIHLKTKELDPIHEVPNVMSGEAKIKKSPNDYLKKTLNNNTIRKKDFNRCSDTNEQSNVSMAHKICSNRTNISNNMDKLQTPLKISSLLNPVAVNYQISNVLQEPNSKTDDGASPNTEHNKSTKDILLTSLSPENFKPRSNKHVKASSFQPLLSTSPNNFSNRGDKSSQINKENSCDSHNDNVNFPDSKIITNNRSDVNLLPVNKSLEILSHHSRKRTLVSQLEQSISNGDVETAAEAAAELAKLRLSCSVLSFSSQIATDNPTVNKSSTKILSPPANVVKLVSTPPEPTKRKDMKSEKSISSVESSNSKKDFLKKSISAESDEIKTKEPDVQPGSSRPSVDQAQELTIKVWIEDKETATGPVNVNIGRHALMVDLMQYAKTFLGLPIHLQRWIVGKNLCTDNKTPLSVLAGVDFSIPFYLCLVQPESKENCKEVSIEESKSSSKVTCSNVYKELINLEKEAIVLNPEPFECDVCMELCGQGDGVVLRECIHIFCKTCLADAIKHCQEAVVECPALSCSGTLQDREIRALLNLDEYERYLARGLVTVESGTRNTFHCRTTDCRGWAFCEPSVRRFPCPVCKHTNCIPCQAIHEGVTCEDYKAKLKNTMLLVEKNPVDEGTQSFLNLLIQKGEALACPECNTIITKKWGCDWIKCSACKTEICWITKGRRWGPAGKGDTSGGCRCGVDGKRCHPTCSYCH